MLTAEILKRWRETGREFMAADDTGIVPTSINDENRTVDIVWYSGADVPRMDYWTGERYMLHFDPAGADLSLLNNGAPVLDDHDSYEGCAGQCGVVVSASMQGTDYVATVRMSRRPEIDGLWQDIKDKIVTKSSMGVEILEMTDTRDGDGKLMTRIANMWRPFELSFTPIPADFATTTLSAQSGIRKPASSQLANHRFLDVEILRLR